MKLCLQACQARNRVIGNEGEVPWYVNGLETFYGLSEGHPVIMGRKTADPLLSPLSNRSNILISSDSSYKKEGFHVSPDSDEAFSYAKTLDSERCFVIGGGSLFRQFLPTCDIIYLVTLLRDFAGDTFFPKILAEKFEKTKSLRYSSNIDFIFETYERNNINITI